jgi:protoheme ferro-lyase
VAARAAAQAAGVGYTRARCVNDHPAFIASIARAAQRAIVG